MVALPTKINYRPSVSSLSVFKVPEQSNSASRAALGEEKKRLPSRPYLATLGKGLGRRFRVTHLERSLAYQQD